MCDTMHPAIKILIGALMIVVGVYSSITHWESLVDLVRAGIGPLLILVGAFIVWLESDEWKIMREEEKQREDSTGLQQEFRPQESLETDEETEEEDHTDILEGTVKEVKDEVRELDSVDYKALLEAEEQGKDRKTVKEFLERRILNS